jgi:hypothetical protein
VDQLTLGMDAEPVGRRPRRRTHPAPPTATTPPSRYRLIPMARLKVTCPEPGALVAEAGVPRVAARELGDARDPAAVATHAAGLSAATTAALGAVSGVLIGAGTGLAAGAVPGTVDARQAGRARQQRDDHASTAWMSASAHQGPGTPVR